MSEVLKRIYDYSLEDIMGDRYGKYSKYIIQDRAIPDVRDGLKPVQRRILFSMFKERNTYDKAYRKSARSVGDIMGKYHPHGDSSIYDAMVRMSQDFKQKEPYIDMHGNNGSIDGDSPAAMRYTEARLSKISSELIKDYDKETVSFAPNFDDTLMEPTVLPAGFPNLIINGTSGISAGYATNIPPHNLKEIIDATIKRIDNKECTLEDIMKIVKGPDFPTGAIAKGINGIKDAYQTGKGKIMIESKISFEKNKSKDQIIITEIPYEVNKSTLVRKMDEIRIDKKIDGIQEVRDESDRNGLRIAIDLKKGANKELIIKYLKKNTELLTSYNFNMVAIVNRRPKQVGLLAILDAYIAHKKEVVIKRTEFDLRHAKARYHIVEGLIKALSILDEVIKEIRKSKNKMDAKNNLVEMFDFTEKQAEAIVMLQLYKLTNTDVTELKNELKKLKELMNNFEGILNDNNRLEDLMKDELNLIKEEYKTDRKTIIENEIKEIKIDEEMLIPKEDVIVIVTKDGYIKRTSYRSYKSSNENDLGIKENDYVIGKYEVNTLDTILLFTDLGNYLYVPVHSIPDAKWKDLGKHISNLITIKAKENIIYSIPVYDFDKNIIITTFTKLGMVKRTKLIDYKVQRYSKPIKAINLKKEDEVVSVSISNYNNIFVATYNGYGLWYDVSEVPISNVKAKGVKSINLKDDYVVNSSLFNDSDYVVVITDKNTAKRIKIDNFEKTKRARRGLLIIREVKSNPYKVLKSYVMNSKSYIGIKTNELIKYIKVTELPINDRYSSGSLITKKDIIETFEIAELINEENIVFNVNEEEVKPNINEDIKTVKKDEFETLDLEFEEINKKDDIIKEVKKEKNNIKEKENINEDIALTIDDFLDDFEF